MPFTATEVEYQVLTAKLADVWENSAGYEFADYDIISDELGVIGQVTVSEVDVHEWHPVDRHLAALRLAWEGGLVL